MDETLLNKYIGEKIKFLRKKFKLSQKQLADELSIHYKHLGCIENGKKAVSISLIAKLSNFFKEEPQYFFDFTNHQISEDNIKLINSTIKMLKSLDSDTRIMIANMIKAAFDCKQK